MVTITAQWKGLQRAIKRVDQVYEQTMDWSGYWRSWSRLWYHSRREMFRTLGQSTQTPWGGYRPEERRYVAVKGKVLDRWITDEDQLRWEQGRERLYPSLTDENDPMTIMRITPTSVTAGTAVEYARNHDQGVGQPPPWAGIYTIPRRPLVQMGMWLEGETEYLLEGWAGALMEALESPKTPEEIEDILTRDVLAGRVP